jgi:hypothetical protein
MKKINHLAALVILLVFSTSLQAQDPSGRSGFDNLMRSSGRIYVVIAVILTILAGLILYLVRLERKIKKMEKEL